MPTRQIAELAAAGRLDPSKITRGAVPAVPRRAGHPRRRPVRPVVRRAAHLELPALAVGVRGAGLPGPALAGLRPSATCGTPSSCTPTATAGTAERCPTRSADVGLRGVRLVYDGVLVGSRSSRTVSLIVVAACRRPSVEGRHLPPLRLLAASSTRAVGQPYPGRGRASPVVSGASFAQRDDADLQSSDLRCARRQAAGARWTHVSAQPAWIGLISSASSIPAVSELRAPERDARRRRPGEQITMLASRTIAGPSPCVAGARSSAPSTPVRLPPSGEKIAWSRAPRR